MPSQLLEARSAFWKADQGWLSASVHQDRLPCFGRVLMQKLKPNTKPWEGMPLHRLMEMKSLSETPKFNIHMINKRTVRKFINRLQHELPKTLAPVHINLHTIYQGRGGAWDAWGMYNGKHSLLPNPSEITGASDSIKAPPCRSPISDEAAPPIYSKTDPNTTCTPQLPSAPPTFKRRLDPQGEDVKHKKIKDDKASPWAWQNTKYSVGSPTEENTPSFRYERLSQQSTVDGQSAHESQSRQEDEVTQGAQPSINILTPDRATQDHTPPGLSLVPDRPCTPDRDAPAREILHNLRSVHSPLYTASPSSTVSLDRVGIKPTIFSERTSSTFTLTLSELEGLISNTIRAQIPLIAAKVQTHNLTSELTAWAQPSIADYIATHMPTIMHEAVSAHVSDVKDEFEHAAAALQETKDDAVTEIRSAEQSGVQEVHRESQIAIDDIQEQSQRLSEALIDKCTELEDRLDGKLTHLAPPDYSRQPLVEVSDAKEAVQVFERFHRDRLTRDEQVRVLLSIAKFSNAAVFVAADLESRNMLVAHWSGRRI